tara:strand:+ start:1154 stop:1438 length:285 start_codon:yes stop_codon:yes gene_type:complete
MGTKKTDAPFVRLRDKVRISDISGLPISIPIADEDNMNGIPRMTMAKEKPMRKLNIRCLSGLFLNRYRINNGNTINILNLAETATPKKLPAPID